jgi:DNA-binding XRE family transcriptional regulator
VSQFKVWRKRAQPTLAERERRAQRYPLGSKRRQQPRPGLYQLELGERLGLAGSTIVDIEKGRLLVTEATCRLIERGCAQTQAERAAFPTDLQERRLEADITIRTLQGAISTCDGRPLHKDTITDVEMGRVEVTEEMYGRFVQAIDRLHAAKTQFGGEVMA